MTKRWPRPGGEALLWIATVVGASCGTSAPEGRGIPASPPPSPASTGGPATPTTTVPAPPPIAAKASPRASPPPVGAPKESGSFAFTIDLLSRGKGVPPQSRQAVRQLQEYVDADVRRGVPVEIRTERLGIEGETRTCVEYRSQSAGAKAYERALKLLGGMDLVNVRMEPCKKSLD